MATPGPYNPTTLQPYNLDPTFTGVLAVVLPTGLVPADHAGDVLPVLVLHDGGVRGPGGGGGGGVDLGVHDGVGAGDHLGACHWTSLSPDGGGRCH